MLSLIQFARLGYTLLVRCASSLQSVFLLVVRLYWGWQFFGTGKGKLQNIEKITGFFQDLGIPLPMAQAYLVGTVECVGGLLLMAGLASRAAALPLTITLFVAYLTADREAALSIFSDADKFLASTPLTFLLATLPVLLFGPGRFSLDFLFVKFCWRTTAENPNGGK